MHELKRIMVFVACCVVNNNELHIKKLGVNSMMLVACK